MLETFRVIIIVAVRGNCTWQLAGSVFSKILTCFVSNSWSEFSSLIRHAQGHRGDARHRTYLFIRRFSLPLSLFLLTLSRYSAIPYERFRLTDNHPRDHSIPLSHVNNELCACFDLSVIQTPRLNPRIRDSTNTNAKIRYFINARQMIKKNKFKIMSKHFILKLVKGYLIKIRLV